ncbi:MAG: substrate-binding domain-containing protein [Verrucomicrobiales bacterium]|jgi:phosphate transport system substrate-binding protein|nr:substrate-binding domain-containing protein [Verrucomicrobiales bacterium]
MKNSPRLVRSLVWLWLVLPLLFTLLAVPTVVLMSIVTLPLPHVWQAPIGVSIGLLALTVLVWRCLVAGKKFVRRAYQDVTGVSANRAPSPDFLARYAGVVIVSGYTLAVALVAIFLPPNGHAVLARFANVFTALHLPACALVWLLHVFSLPPLWVLLAPPAVIYLSFAAGMALEFRALQAPPTRWRGRWLFALALTVGALMFMWRLNALRVDLVTGGKRLDDRELTYQFNPWHKSHKLVRVDAPTLTISGDFPRLDGATALYPLYAAAARAVYQRDWSRWSAENSALLKVSKTPQAYQNLLEGSADLIFALRPSAEQIAAAAARGVEYRLTPLGYDAFVFFVRRDNPVSGLTTAQLRDIYTRRVTDWAQVGGRAGKILPFQRPQDSGSQTAMETLVMRGEPLAPPLLEELALGMGEIVREVAAYRNRHAAIGYSFRYFVETMAGGEQLKLLAIDGVSPSAPAIRAGDYPLVSEICAVTTDRTAGLPNVKKLIAWLQSEQGRRLIEAVGYIPSRDR